MGRSKVNKGKGSSGKKTDKDSNWHIIKVGSRTINLKEIEFNRANLKKLFKVTKERHTKARYLPLILITFAILLLAFSFIWSVVIFPKMAVIPDNMEMTISLVGKANVINESNGARESINISASISTKFGKSQGNEIPVNQTVSLMDEDNNVDLISKYEGIIEESKEMNVDRRTGEILSGGGGQLLLPMNSIDEDEYPFFNLDTSSIGLISYEGKKEIKGLDTLEYRMKMNNEYLGEYEAMGPVPPIIINFTGNTNYWFEKRTGIPVDVDRQMTLHSDLPDLLKVPDGLVQNRLLIGKALLVDMVDTTKKVNVDMEVPYNITTTLQLGSTLVMWENMTGYDSNTGEKLPEVYQLPVYKRKISINQNTAEHVYEPRLKGTNLYDRREGNWMFPFGDMSKKPKKFDWFNQVTNTTMDCIFQGQEEHRGMNTYKFMIAAENYNMKPLDSKVENMVMIYDGYQEYWADAETGIIYDIHLNFSLSILSVNDPYDYENKTLIASVDVIMDSNSIEESRNFINQARGFFPYSEKRLMVFTGTLELSSASQKELVDNAEEMSFLILLGSTIVPYSTMGFGIVSLFTGGFLKRKRDLLWVDESDATSR